MGELAAGGAAQAPVRTSALPSLRRWLSGWRTGSARVVLETGVVVLCALEVLAWQEVRADSYFAVAAATLVAVLARLRWPVAAALVVGPALGWTSLLLTPLVLLFTAGQKERRDGVVVALVVWTVVSSAALMTWQDSRYLVSDGPLRLITDVAAAIAMAAGAAGLGRLVRTRREQSAALRELVAGRARERALAEHAARAEERAHLAREMHDVVASQVTLIAVQAAGLRMLPDVDDRTRAVAETIRAAAAQTTRELREVLADLRGPEQLHGPAPQARAVCLGELDRLWASAGCAGQLVVQVPDGAEVAAPVQRAAYRILQEGLTNAVRYAPGAVVRAGVEVVASTLVVSVVNGPPPASSTTTAAAGEAPVPQPAAPDATGASVGRALSTGNGLVGVRERAQALGGYAGWGATDDGGHQLTAVLPLKG
ncbi:sensor histidine kinase [Quadrisphaera setariae]|uniref:sensor histidine kinase n=1 Tax=Quadrisphaera setariae TaxID=2593304 RepID=UPI00164F38AC|nr:histidine kinase [Quadrisphaera setariae]